MSFQFLTGGRLTQVLHLPLTSKLWRFLCVRVLSFLCFVDKCSSYLPDGKGIKSLSSELCDAEVRTNFPKGMRLTSLYPTFFAKFCVFQHVQNKSAEIRGVGAAEEGGQRVQLPTQISDEGRLAFRQGNVKWELIRAPPKGGGGKYDLSGP